MAIAFHSEQTFNAGTGATQFTDTLSLAPPSGALGVMNANIAGAGSAVTNVDNQTNATWASAFASTTNYKSSTWYGLFSGVGGLTVRITTALLGVANTSHNFSFFTGLPAGGGYNAGASGSATAASGTAVATPSVTPTAGAEVLLVAMMRGVGTAGATPAGWTAMTPGGNGTQFFYMIVPSASGSYQASNTWGTSGAWVAHIACFEVTATVTAVVTTQPPECIANSAVHGLVVAKYLGGVLDPTASGNVTLNLQSGSGSTAGSTLVVAFTPGTGLATFTNLVVTVTAGNGGPKVWRATLPTGQTADATSVIVRETLFATTGNYTTHQTIRDPQANFLHIAEVFIPNGATTSTPLDVMVFLSGGSKAYGDPATNGSSSDPIPSLVASRLSTFPMVLVRICVSSNNPPTTTVPWCLAVQALITRLVSDGMNVRRRGYYGWSTGGINGNIIVAALPGYFRWMMLIDPSITDNGLTGDGILGQPLPNSYVDPGPDNQDTAAINECMRRYVAYGTAMWLTHSNQAFTNPPPPGQTRNIFSQVEPMAAIDALVAPADQFQKLTFAATTLPAITPTRPYVQARHTTGTSDHSEVDQTTAAAANWDAVTYPWIVDKNNSPNPVMGGGAYDYGSGRGRRRRSVGAMR